MHVVCRVLQWRKPCGPQVGDIHLLVGKLHKSVEGLRVYEVAVQAEYEHSRDAPELAFAYIDDEHYRHHEQRIQKHKKEYGSHTFVRRAHLECLYKRRERYCLARARIPQYRGRLAPHVAYEALAHADKRGRNEYEQHVYERSKTDIEYLAPHPRGAPYARKVIWHPRAEEGHVGEQQNEQH